MKGNQQAPGLAMANELAAFMRANNITELGGLRLAAQQPPVAVDATPSEAAPAGRGEQDAKDAALGAWLHAEQARRDAVAAYNAAVRETEKEIWPGRDCNPEFQAMTVAQNEESRRRRALFDSLTSQPTKE